MAVLDNGVLRWYVRFHAQNAEKAFSAKVLIDAIDKSYENIERAPALVQGARKELMEEMERTSFALEPSVDVKKFAMGHFAYTQDDQALVHQRMVGNISEAHRRAKSINTVRFIHLLEAKALQGGFSVPPKAPVDSVLEVDVIDRFELSTDAKALQDRFSVPPKAPVASVSQDMIGSELEVDVIGRFELSTDAKAIQGGSSVDMIASELEVDVIGRFEELRQGVRNVPERDNSAVSTEVSEYY